MLALHTKINGLASYVEYQSAAFYVDVVSYLQYQSAAYVDVVQQKSKA